MSTRNLTTHTVVFLFYVIVISQGYGGGHSLQLVVSVSDRYGASSRATTTAIVTPLVASVVDTKARILSTLGSMAQAGKVEGVLQVAIAAFDTVDRDSSSSLTIRAALTERLLGHVVNASHLQVGRVGLFLLAFFCRGWIMPQGSRSFRSRLLTKHRYSAPLISAIIGRLASGLITTSQYPISVGIQPWPPQ